MHHHHHEEETGGIEEFKRLMLEGRFYEAHVTAEGVMRGLDWDLGRCLAIYSALALKVNEDLPRAVEHLYGLLWKRGCWRYVDLECARRIAGLVGRARVDGEVLACLLPLY